MKKAIFIAFVLLLSFSCNNKFVLYDKSHKNQKEFEVLVDDFKYDYFKKCLQLGLNNSKAVNEILNQETGISDFPLGLYNYKYIDSLALETKQFIIKDSISFYTKWIKNNRDYKLLKLTGKRTIYHCLDYYKSKELDSIAKSRIKKINTAP